MVESIETVGGYTVKKLVAKSLDHTIIILYDEHFHSLNTVKRILYNEAKKVVQNTKQLRLL